MPKVLAFAPPDEIPDVEVYRTFEINGVEVSALEVRGIGCLSNRVKRVTKEFNDCGYYNIYVDADNNYYCVAHVADGW